MAVSGKIDDFGLPGVMQLLSASKRTGKLTLTRRDGHGVIVLRHGRIIYAATHSLRQTFGSLLLCQGLIDEATLAEALERFQQAGQNKRLGAILVEMGKVRREDLELVMRHQTKTVLAELLLWKDGFFKFEPLEIPEGGEIDVDVRDLLMTRGVAVDQALLAAFSAPEGADHPQPDGAAPVPAAAVPLRQIVAELPPPALRGELSQRLLRAASELVDRGALFLVFGAEAELFGHFGLPDPGPDRPRLELGGSLLAEALLRHEAYRGALQPSPSNRRLLALLGGQRPEEALALPLLAHDVPVIVFYGDNQPSGRPIAPSDALEEEFRRAGLEMERVQLEARIRHFEARSGEDATRTEALPRPSSGR